MTMVIRISTVTIAIRSVVGRGDSIFFQALTWIPRDDMWPVGCIAQATGRLWCQTNDHLPRQSGESVAAVHDQQRKWRASVRDASMQKKH